MGKFIFKMESVLNLRARTEDIKKQEFGDAIYALNKEKEILEKLITDRQNAVLKLKNDIGIKISPIEFRQLNIYIDFLKKKIASQKIEVKKAEDFVEIKRVELIAATKEKKIMEKLKENKYEEYIEEEKQTEQKIVDEIVSYRYNG